MKRTPLHTFVLYPLSRVYGLCVWVRNKMFDWHILRQHTFDVPVIAVGNVAVGGTGKTPHVEYIVNELLRDHRVGVLSRGYKRETKDFVLATAHSTPRDIGDEAYQVYHKFGRKAMVAVCRNRVQGIRRMLEIDPKLDVIVLDDALQHRYVKPDVTVVLTEFDRPVFNDDLLPYGRLRESKRALHRADIVVVTKCPHNIKPIEFNIFDKDLDLIPDQGRHYSRFRYEALRPVFPELAVPAPNPAALTVDDRLLSVTGIANPRQFVRFLKSFKAKVRVNVFPDHHQFTRKDCETIRQRFESMAGRHRYIVTTEKDAVRLLNNPYFPHEIKPYIFYIPIQVEFLQRDGIKPGPTFAADLRRRLQAIRKA